MVGCFGVQTVIGYSANTKEKTSSSVVLPTLTLILVVILGCCVGIVPNENSWGGGRYGDCGVCAGILC
jgi:hypothetical protein